MKIDTKSWDLVAEDKELHNNKPAAAYFHKKNDLIALVKKWAQGSLEKGPFIKTDLMEESVRIDDVLFDLAKESPRAVGMDISFKLTSLARARPENNGSNINYAVCDARGLCFKNDTFELILSNSTLDHFPEIELGIQEAYRVLKPGGVMVITIHNKLEFTFYMYHVFKKILGYSPHFHFEKTYTPWQVRDLLKRSGFIIEDYSTTAHVPLGFWTMLYGFVYTCELYGRRPGKFANRLVSWIVGVIETIEKKQTLLNYFIGMLLAFKVRKADNGG